MGRGGACTDNPGLSSFIASPFILSHKRNDFRGGGEGEVTENVLFDFLYKFCPKHFSY